MLGNLTDDFYVLIFIYFIEQLPGNPEAYTNPFLQIINFIYFGLWVFMEQFYFEGLFPQCAYLRYSHRSRQLPGSDLPDKNKKELDDKLFELVPIEIKRLSKIQKLKKNNLK